MVSTVETECTPSQNQCKTTKFFTTELLECKRIKEVNNEQ
jgi:hypothetical protein